jgi:hypothetical protein
MAGQELFGTLPLIFRETGFGTRQMMEGFIHQNHVATDLA